MGTYGNLNIDVKFKKSHFWTCSRGFEPQQAEVVSMFRFCSLHHPQNYISLIHC
jgi:ribulose bisphosphate carboxylase small subunit